MFVVHGLSPLTGANGGIADITFVDWGLARATAEILNAVLDGRLVKASEP
jgi:hypothetical protein